MCLFVIFMLKWTISRDWGELLMVEIDKIHFFNAARDGLFLILIAFSSKKVKKKQYEPAVLFASAPPRTSGLPGTKKSVGRWSPALAAGLPTWPGRSLQVVASPASHWQIECSPRTVLFTGLPPGYIPWSAACQ